jgi:hypothetical protein
MRTSEVARVLTGFVFCILGLSILYDAWVGAQNTPAPASIGWIMLIIGLVAWFLPVQSV